MTNSVPRHSRTRPLTVLAQDPGTLGTDGAPLLTQISVPAEQLAPGPCGYRVRVVDYDASSGTLYKPMPQDSRGQYVDQFYGEPAEKLLANPQFHQQNVYAIAMRVLGCFESALGRHVRWQFGTHQLKIVPHAFREANAFYSRDDQALLFGYFARTQAAVAAHDKSKHIFTCLSHDIVAHETGHALLDGVRKRFLLPSLSDQAAFHEGFSDLVAILSVASIPELVEQLLERNSKSVAKTESDLSDQIRDGTFVVEHRPIDSMNLGKLARQIGPAFPLFSLAEEMGKDTSGMRQEALRRSLEIEPSRTATVDSEFSEPHRRGELLVAAVLRAVMNVTNERCFRIGIPAGGHARCECRGKDHPGPRRVSRSQLAECLAESASDLLTMCIRAIDYVAPVHLSFAHYLTGLLTADSELVPNDNRYNYRRHVREAFLAYGIGSTSVRDDGIQSQAREADHLRLSHTDHQAMMSDRDEMFRFIWENRAVLGVSDEFYTKVTSVNPCIRVGPDGVLLFETIVEYTQSARIRAGDLARRGLRRPLEMSSVATVALYGGGTLIFDVRGELKYHFSNRIDDVELQNAIIQYNFDRGVFRMNEAASLANFHETRSLSGNSERFMPEVWS